MTEDARYTEAGPTSAPPSSQPPWSLRPRLPWPPHGDVVLEARGLVRDLGTTVKTRALSGIDVAVHERELVSLTGLSGSGKSTLLYLLGALDRPTAGTVLIDGIDIAGLDDDERAALRSRKLGFVFQFHFLLPEFNVLENVTIPMLRRGDKHKDEAEAHGASVLAAMGLGDLLWRRPHQLSGGQQQRVSIARAIANDPRIVLADEPTGNLDSKNGSIVIETFERLAREEGRTIIMVTHERSFAARASRQIVLSDGLIVEDIDQSRRVE